MTRIAAREPLRRVGAAASTEPERKVTALRALELRRSDSVPTLADRGRVDAVNALVEMTFTLSRNASPERWSAAVALTAAPAVGTRIRVASSAAHAAATRSEDLMERN